MIALKDNLGSEFVERVRGFFSENGPLSKARTLSSVHNSRRWQRGSRKRWRKNSI